MKSKQILDCVITCGITFPGCEILNFGFCERMTHHHEGREILDFMRI